MPHSTALPVLLSIPHSGRDLPGWLVEEAVGGRDALAALSDPQVDRLAGRAVAAGHGAVIAKAARAAVDCNRAPDDIDPAIVAGRVLARPTRRARGGLGVIPDRTALHGHLWKRPLGADDLHARIAEAHAPYHRAIEHALDTLAVRSGQALLLDCHSMPPRRGQAELVIGSRHGTSAADWISRDAAAIARAEGWIVALNQPFAGGFIVERHGRPDQGRHALQLEICRSTYLDNRGNPSTGFDSASRLIARLARDLGAALIDTDATAVAAE